MGTLHEDLRTLRDEWIAEPTGSSLLHFQAAVRLMHLLDRHPESGAAHLAPVPTDATEGEA